MTGPGDRELLQIVEASMAEAVRRGGDWVVCRPGCFQCCLGPFDITPLDAARLRQGLHELEGSDPLRAGQVRKRASEWPGGDDTPCPVLDPVTGCCELYEARPIICRSFGPAVRAEDGSVGVCELCFEGATDAEIAACAVDMDPKHFEDRLLATLDQPDQSAIITVAGVLA